MSWSKDTKQMRLFQDYTVTCKCGHRVRLMNKPNVICNWCGEMVYLNKNEQKRHDFKKEMRKILNEKYN